MILNGAAPASFFCALDKNFGRLHFRYRNYNTHDRRYIAWIEAAGFESSVFGMEEKAVHMNWV
jgi:hypothetical protein|tara:strand:- start:213 stop:401 length:189 start_codon:yes stop_codon:yes gene_type:complete